MSKANKKTRMNLVLLSAVLLFATVVGMSIRGVAWWNIRVKMQNLKLADDGSTPTVKAKYIGLFIEDMDRENLPDYGVFVFKHPRNNVANQREIILSLKQRCDELVGVDPSSLGYAKGMEQISGQEFDHALSEGKKVFEDAMWVKQGWFLAYGTIILLVITLIWGVSFLAFAFANKVDRDMHNPSYDPLSE